MNTFNCCYSRGIPFSRCEFGRGSRFHRLFLPLSLLFCQYAFYQQFKIPYVFPSCYPFLSHSFHIPVDAVLPPAAMSVSLASVFHPVKSLLRNLCIFCIMITVYQYYNIIHGQITNRTTDQCRLLYIALLTST